MRASQQSLIPPTLLLLSFLAGGTGRVDLRLEWDFAHTVRNLLLSACVFHGAKSLQL